MKFMLALKRNRHHGLVWARMDLGGTPAVDDHVRFTL